jgi:hypothetical protein
MGAGEEKTEKCIGFDTNRFVEVEVQETVTIVGNGQYALSAVQAEPGIRNGPVQWGILLVGIQLQLAAAVLGLRTFVPVRQKHAEFLEGHLIQILYHGKQLPVFKNANGVTVVTPLL